jgi:hypothetical protein
MTLAPYSNKWQKQNHFIQGYGLFSVRDEDKRSVDELNVRLTFRAYATTTAKATANKRRNICN